MNTDSHRQNIYFHRLLSVLMGDSRFWALGLWCGLTLLPCLAQAQAGAPLPSDFFSKKLYPILQTKGCRACHAEDGVASATRLHFPLESASAEEIEAFGRNLVVLVDRNHPQESPLFKKPTLRIEHTGGKLIPPGSDEEQVLLRWINYLATAPTDSLSQPQATVKNADKTTLAPVVVRRLTHSQYDNTVRDLLGDESRPASQFPQEDFVNGFQNQAAVQNIPPLLAEAYSAAAQKLAQNAYQGGHFKDLVSCKAIPANDSGCGVKFIRNFGLRAFRRPLTDAETSRYLALFKTEAAHTREPARGAQIVVEAMLQSPSFLFRLERGPGGPWKQYEKASRLSYFLWNTMPDNALLQAAAAGRLATAAELESVARQMIHDRRAQQSLDDFVSQWLRFDRLLNTVRDRRRFPEFTPELAMDMTEETKRLVADLVWNDCNFMEILTADYGFLSSDLAKLYGFPAPGEEFALVKFPPTSDRAGILGEGTFLSLTSKPGNTSPTGRGLFIREQLLCQKVPNPPPGTNMNLPIPSESKPLTTRERLTMHRANETCSRCHNLIDPIGFGLERFDAIGKRRDKESVEFSGSHGDHAKPKVVELHLDATGVVRGIPNSDFSSPRQLGAILAAQPVCQNCIVKQLFRYVFGRMETPADERTLENAERTFRDSQFRFKELMMALVKSEPFLN